MYAHVQDLSCVWHVQGVADKFKAMLQPDGSVADDINKALVSAFKSVTTHLVADLAVCSNMHPVHVHATQHVHPLRCMACALHICTQVADLAVCLPGFSPPPGTSTDAGGDAPEDPSVDVPSVDVPSVEAGSGATLGREPASGGSGATESATTLSAAHAGSSVPTATKHLTTEEEAKRA